MPGRDSLLRICGLALLSLVEFRVFFGLHHEHLTEMAEAAYEVTVGTPHWPAFQNRLLGPYAVAAWSAITGQAYVTAHTLLLVVLMVAANLTAFAMFRRLTGSSDLGFRYTVYFLSAFLALMVNEWVFVWDFVEMPVFLLFAYGVFTRQPWSYFLPLFVVGLLNRESALFIAAWVVIDGVARKLPRHVWAGVAMAAAGVAYTVGMRRLLFVRSSLENPPAFVELPVVGSQFNIVESAYRAGVHLLNPGFDMVFVIHLAYVALAAYFARHWQAVRAQFGSQLVLVAMMLAAVPVFGVFDETRQYAYLVPLLLAFNLALHGKIGACPARQS